MKSERLEQGLGCEGGQAVAIVSSSQAEGEFF